MDLGGMGIECDGAHCVNSQIINKNSMLGIKTKYKSLKIFCILGKERGGQRRLSLSGAHVELLCLILLICKPIHTTKIFF